MIYRQLIGPTRHINHPLSIYKQGTGGSGAVTILALDGARHFLKTTRLMQIIGITLSGLGGSNALRDGLSLSGAIIFTAILQDLQEAFTY